MKCGERALIPKGDPVSMLVHASLCRHGCELRLKVDHYPSTLSVLRARLPRHERPKCGSSIALKCVLRADRLRFGPGPKVCTQPKNYITGGCVVAGVDQSGCLVP